MVSLIDSGTYRLVETKADTKLLIMGDNTYAWITVDGIGEILVTSNKQHRIESLLSSGQYRLYDVDDEPKLTDLLHLELEAGLGEWQGYLLLTGLPDEQKKRSRIVPTTDLVNNPDN